MIRPGARVYHARSRRYGLVNTMSLDNGTAEVVFKEGTETARVDELESLTPYVNTLSNMISDVADFHDRFDQPIRDKPAVVMTRLPLRWKLVAEEFKELHDALGIGTQTCPKLVDVADGIADSIYVLIGMALEFGIPLDEVWKRVHASNMAKEPGRFRADGKVTKPEGWTAPDVRGALEMAGWDGVSWRE